MKTPAAGSPVRVIYAKLTTTGAYDVVAHTANIPLDEARSLAERLLPGNPPLDVSVSEEVSHSRPPEGGHIVMRFARYDWSDGDRGDVYITDIAWYADADFTGARSNAFALVPRTTRLFAERVELPPFTVALRDAAADAARITELRQAAPDAKTVVASAAATDPLLLIHPGDRAGAMELFTLLLPPRLRAALTFQTVAFRVPAVIPRITIVDRGHANLRDAPWKVLPSLDVDVPLELAGRFLELAGDTSLLQLVHTLHDQAFDDVPDTRTSIARIIALAAVAAPLQRGDIAGLLQVLAGADARVRTAVLRALPDETALQLADSLRPGAAPELVIELANRCARSGDVPRLLQLIGMDRRAVMPRIDIDGAGIAGDVRALVLALRESSGPRHDLDSAAQLLRAAVEVNPRVRSTAAAEPLQRMCRDAVSDAMDRAPATVAAVDALLRLRAAADSYAAELSPVYPLPPLLAPYEMHAADAAQRTVDAYGAASRAVVGAAMLDRATVTPAESALYVRHAVALLTAAAQPGRELARQLLHARSLHEHDIITLPGSDTLLPLLGGNAQQAALTHRIVAAINAVASGGEAAVPDLAVAVVTAHAQRVRIVANSDLSRSVISALTGMAAAQQRNAPAVDVCLELLGIITEPSHIPELEDAALGDAMTPRLQRLDRSVALCQAAEREDRYERYARAVESSDVPLSDSTRERLRDALGTRGLQRRLMRAVSSVVERDAT